MEEVDGFTFFEEILCLKLKPIFKKLVIKTTYIKRAQQKMFNCQITFEDMKNGFIDTYFNRERRFFYST